jgi:uncharacterized membrane protein YfcA
MSGLALALLAVVALLTSMFSAVTGMGGGFMLLAVMFSFLPHAEAIPTHAAVQLASNGTRILVFIRNVDAAILARFSIGAVPGSVIGALLLWRLGKLDDYEPYIKTLVGAYILGATFWPRRSGGDPSKAAWDFTVMGFVSGVAALTVGAVGPLIAPLFAGGGFEKERVIATKATCQMVTHVLKIPAFVFLLGDRFDLTHLGGLTAVMIVMVVLGTLAGKRIVSYISPEWFAFMFRAILLVAGVKVLVFDGIVRLV